VRMLLHLPLEIATAFFFAASVGVGAGVATISYTHRLGDGLRIAFAAFLAAAVAFGYVIWRTYRPRSRTLRPVRTAHIAAPH